jgi:hypothetical protein
MLLSLLTNLARVLGWRLIFESTVIETVRLCYFVFRNHSDSASRRGPSRGLALMPQMINLSLLSRHIALVTEISTQINALAYVSIGLYILLLEI